jgi:hypothetical protein
VCRSIGWNPKCCSKSGFQILACLEFSVLNFQSNITKAAGSMTSTIGGSLEILETSVAMARNASLSAIWWTLAANKEAP